MKCSTLFFLFLIPLASRAEPPLTLAAATQAALTHNRTLLEARARWEAMKARVPQAAAWDDLKISTMTTTARFVDIAPNSFTDHLLTVEQMIPLSGKNRSRARIAAAEALASWEELRRQELDVALRVRAAYIRLANTRALVVLNRTSDSSLSQSLTLSRGQLEVGGQTQADVLTAESAVIRIGEARRDLQRTTSEQETQLAVLMNRDPFAPLGELVGELPSHAALDVASLRRLILNDRPEVRREAARVAGATAKMELAGREWIPDPAISVGAARYNDASSAVSEITAGVSFNVPWLNPKKYRAGEAEARANAAAAQHALEAMRTEALGLLRDQLARIDTAHHHLALYHERLLPALREVERANRASYESGKLGLLDFLKSQRERLEAEAMERQHLSDYQVALAELEALVGADLHLFPSGERRKP